MQIEQYQRREIPIGSAGNVISRQPNSYAELGRLGETMTDIGFAMEEQRLKVQYHDEMTSAQLEFKKRSLEHEESLDPNNTDQWEADTDIFQKQTSDEILSKMKHGKAKDDASAWMKEENLYNKKAISTYRTQMDFRNASANYRNNRPLAIENAAKQPSEYQYDNSRLGWVRSQYGMELKDPKGPVEMDNLQTVKEGYDSPIFPTEELRRSEVAVFLSDTNKLREQYQKDALSDRIVGEALAMEPEQAMSHIDATTEIARREYGKKEDFFDNKELNSLKSEYNQTRNLRKAVVNQQSEAVEADLSARIAQFDLSKEPEKRISELRQEIATNPLFDGTQIRELSHFLDSRITNAGKKATEREILEAKDNIQNLIDADKRGEAKKILFEKSWMFTTSDNESLLEDIRGTKATDPMLTDALAAEEAVADSEVKASDPPDVVGKRRVESMRRKEVIRKQWREHPDMTPKEKAAFTEGLLQPAKDEAAKKGIVAWWNWYRYGEGGTETLQGKLRRQRQEANLPMIFSDADYDALPSGAEFIDPDGKKRKKP